MNLEFCPICNKPKFECKVEAIYKGGLVYQGESVIKCTYVLLESGNVPATIRNFKQCEACGYRQEQREFLYNERLSEYSKYYTKGR